MEDMEVTPENIPPKYLLKMQMYSLHLVVSRMSALYEQHPELNDQVDIQRLIPMSLDEWKCELEDWLEHH